MLPQVEPWVIYAFIAFIGYFLVAVLFKVVAAENPLVVSLFLYATAAILMLGILTVQRNFSLSPSALVVSCLIGLSSVFGTIFALKAVNLAPNPGYPAAIYSASVVLVTVVSVWVFHSEFSPIKFLGIILSLIGVIILSI